MVDKEKILAGRKAVDAYREAHRQLHSKPWHRGVPEEHTPLLEKLVADLEKIGITSAELDFESKKTEILAKFFDASEELNVKELGFASREDFTAEISRLNIDAERYTKINEEAGKSYEVIVDTPEAQALRETLRLKWG